MRATKRPSYAWLGLGMLLQLTSVAGAERALTGLNFAQLAGGKVQIRLTMDGLAVAPKVFQTNNPARIALDFWGLKSALDKKRFTLNQGVADSVSVVETKDRTRVVINLAQTVPFETRLLANTVYVILKPRAGVGALTATKQTSTVKQNTANPLAQQAITTIDFRRGAKGEGRLLVALSTSNTVVDVSKERGKVRVHFPNTQLSDDLAKRYDVTDFATPVQTIDAQTNNADTNLTITLNEAPFDYSSYQSEGLLTVSFTPLTASAKAARLSEQLPYTGAKLSLNFQAIEVRSVLQILANFSKFNIIADDSVVGTVTLHLDDVPWDQALDLILKSNGLATRKIGNAILVAPIARIKSYDEKALAAKKIAEQLMPLSTEYIQINYAEAADIQALLVGNYAQQAIAAVPFEPDSLVFSEFNSTANRGNMATVYSNKRMLSARGHSTVDTRTNVIIVKDTAKQLAQIRKILSIIDVPVRQVMIEARIVIADTNFAREIGVKFGAAKAARIGNSKSFTVGGLSTFYGAGANSARGGAPSTGTGVNSVGGTVPGIEGNPSDPNYVANLATGVIQRSPIGALGITLARGADYVLNLELSALENKNRGKILANPRILTSDRKVAYIKQGVQIPFTTVSDKGTKTELVDAVLELNVLPHITPEGNVIMDLLIKKDEAVATGNGRIAKREIATNVRIMSGETIVLGGVYEDDISNATFKVPWLADLPIIGWLFKKNLRSDRKMELLIFITPKIVDDTVVAG